MQGEVSGYLVTHGENAYNRQNARTTIPYKISVLTSQLCMNGDRRLLHNSYAIMLPKVELTLKLIDYKLHYIFVNAHLGIHVLFQPYTFFV